MRIREPAVAGKFYPFNSSQLEKMIERFFFEAKVDPLNAKAIVAPHAGYEHCGKTAATVYKSVAGDFDTIVILGPNHTGMGAGVSTSLDTWRTPLGNVPVDEEFAKAIMEDTIITDDYRSHLQEHSIEVQLPWLQYRFKDFNFVPIVINPIYYKIDTCKEIGNKISEVASKLKRNILIVASSDFTHHGSVYGNTVYKGPLSQILKKMKEFDLEIAGYASKIMPERIIEVCDANRCTVCGYGPISASLWGAKNIGAKEGKILDYSTSFEVARNANAIVAYCGIILY